MGDRVFIARGRFGDWVIREMRVTRESDKSYSLKRVENPYKLSIKNRMISIPKTVTKGSTKYYVFHSKSDALLFVHQRIRVRIDLLEDELEEARQLLDAVNKDLESIESKDERNAE